MATDTDEVIDGEVIEEAEGTALAVREPAPVTLFRTDDPSEVVARATATADALMDAVRKHDAGKPMPKRLVSVIQGREFPKVECWTLLGTMLGVFPVCVWTRKLDEGGWEARVEAHTLGGQVVGAAEAQCARSESTWKSRDDYAIRSMAQTRATSKALRIPLGFVMTLAGLEATPAEEMPTGGGNGVETRTVAPPDPAPATAARPRKVNERQVQKIGVLRSELKAAGAVTEEQYRAVLKAEYGAASTKDLTNEQARELIDRLEAKRASLPTVAPAPSEGEAAVLAELDKLADETIVGPPA